MMEERKRVVPLGSFDETIAAKKTIVPLMYFVEGQLDVEKLQRAWSRLMQRWPIMLARLNIDESNNNKWSWHFHDPPLKSSVSDNGSVENFTVLDSFRDITIKNRLPTSADGVTIHDLSDLVNMYSLGAKGSDQLAASDRPVTSVQVTRFADVTCLTYYSPHAMCDMKGAEFILRTWTASLDEDYVPDPIPYLQQDPFRQYPASQAKGLTDSPPSWRIVTDPKAEAKPEAAVRREIHIPRNFTERVRWQVQSDIAKEDRVSTGDILVAWLVKAAIDCRTDLETKVTLGYPFDLRMSDLPSPPPLGFFFNAAHIIAFPPQSVGWIQSQSIGQYALWFRKTLLSLKRPQVLQDEISWQKLNSDKVRMFGERGGIRFSCSNLRAFKSHTLDFKKALVQPSSLSSTQRQENLTGRVFMFTRDVSPHPATPYMSWIGIDDTTSNGGFWLGAFLPEKTWLQISSTLQSAPSSRL